MTEPSHLPTLEDCVHCGLCLPVCPTYEVTGREVQSPRGRIAALRGVHEGRVDFSPAIREGLEDCLVCRACESACPSGVSMEALMAGHREHTRGTGADLATRIEQWWLENCVADEKRLAAFAGLTRVFAPVLRSRLVARLLKRLPIELPAPPRLSRGSLPKVVEAHGGTPRGSVVILRGCIADHWFRDETLASARVLARNGWRVELPSSGCCGSLHRHAGLARTAQDLAERCSERLLASAPDHVVVDSSGCAATLLEPADTAIARRVTDTLSLLVSEGWTPPKSHLAGDWVVAPPCHQQHGTGTQSATQSVLEQTLACGYRELPPPDHCCGAAGTYLARRPGMSRAIGNNARLRFESSGAGGVLAGNPGCLLRWQNLLEETPGAEALHPVVAVDRAYALEAGQG